MVHLFVIHAVLLISNNSTISSSDELQGYSSPVLWVEPSRVTDGSTDQDRCTAGETTPR